MLAALEELPLRQRPKYLFIAASDRLATVARRSSIRGFWRNGSQEDACWSSRHIREQHNGLCFPDHDNAATVGLVC